MPVLLETEWQIGWKHKNKNDPILVIKFINQKTSKLLFTYAPKHNEKSFFLDIFQQLEEYEKEKTEKKILKEKEKRKRKNDDIAPNIS